MKIFIFGLVIAFFIFKIGYWSNAYSQEVNRYKPKLFSELKYFENPISKRECSAVLHKGNLVYMGNAESTLEYNLLEFVYKGYLYMVERHYDKSVKPTRYLFTCKTKNELK